MNSISNTYKKTGQLHHAYCCVGEKEYVVKELWLFFEKDLKIKTQGNPDFLYLDYPAFGVDDGRLVNEMQQKKSFDSERKIFVISIGNITHEAQNSLLKMFEEPTENTHFFIIVRSANIFLPTVKSRLMIVDVQGRALYKKGDAVADFLAKNPPQRLALLANIIEEKDKIALGVFLDSLLVVLRGKIEENKISKAQIKIFEEIMKCRGYLSDRSPSVKMIAEHLANII